MPLVSFHEVGKTYRSLQGVDYAAAVAPRAAPATYVPRPCSKPFVLARFETPPDVLQRTTIASEAAEVKSGLVAPTRLPPWSTGFTGRRRGAGRRGFTRTGSTSCSQLIRTTSPRSRPRSRRRPVEHLMRLRPEPCARSLMRPAAVGVLYRPTPRPLPARIRSDAGARTSGQDSKPGQVRSPRCPRSGKSVACQPTSPARYWVHFTIRRVHTCRSQTICVGSCSRAD